MGNIGKIADILIIAKGKDSCKQFRKDNPSDYAYMYRHGQLKVLGLIFEGKKDSATTVPNPIKNPEKTVNIMKLAETSYDYTQFRTNHPLEYAYLCRENLLELLRAEFKRSNRGVCIQKDVREVIICEALSEGVTVTYPLPTPGDPEWDIIRMSITGLIREGRASIKRRTIGTMGSKNGPKDKVFKFPKTKSLY